MLRRVEQRLTEAGLLVTAPVAGELVTSLDMAGVSVSLTVLTPRSVKLWLAPVSAPSFSRPALDLASLTTNYSLEPETVELTVRAAPSSAESRACAETVTARAAAAAAAMKRSREELGRLDAIAGDGDHGNGMATGTSAALAAMRAAVSEALGLGTVLMRGGEAWSDVAGGTSGALWGAGLVAAGRALGDTDAPGVGGLAAAVEAFASEVMRRGDAQPGDKTMVDAIVPFAERIAEGKSESAGESPSELWMAAAEAADAAARATAELQARRGRSRTHGERSIGVADPGATSFALLVRALGGPGEQDDTCVS